MINDFDLKKLNAHNEVNFRLKLNIFLKNSVLNF